VIEAASWEVIERAMSLRERKHLTLERWIEGL